MALKRGAIKKEATPMRIVSREEAVETNAHIVARMVTSVDSDSRGDFLQQVSDELYRMSQGYTGDLFKKIAREYNGQ